MKVITPFVSSCINELVAKVDAEINTAKESIRKAREAIEQHKSHVEVLQRDRHALLPPKAQPHSFEINETWRKIGGLTDSINETELYINRLMTFRLQDLSALEVKHETWRE